MARSCKVAGNRPIRAMAQGEKVENARGSKSSPTVRITWPPRRWPELSTPRSSSLSRRKESASSISSVGRTFSITRYTAAGETLTASSERGVTPASQSSNVVLPQPGVGDVMPSRGDTSAIECA